MPTWPPWQGRCVDGAPTLRIPSCAGECPSPLMSANTRRTEPRETKATAHRTRNVEPTHRKELEGDTSRLDTASRLHTSRHQPAFSDTAPPHRAACAKARQHYSFPGCADTRCLARPG